MEEKYTLEEIENYLSKIAGHKPRVISTKLAYKYGVNPTKYQGVCKITEFAEITKRHQKSPSPLEEEILKESLDLKSA